MLIKMTAMILPDSVPMQLYSNHYVRFQSRVFEVGAVFEMEATNYSHVPISMIKIFIWISSLIISKYQMNKIILLIYCMLFIALV